MSGSSTDHTGHLTSDVGGNGNATSVFDSRQLLCSDPDVSAPIGLREPAAYFDPRSALTLDMTSKASAT